MFSETSEEEIFGDSGIDELCFEVVEEVVVEGEEDCARLRSTVTVAKEEFPVESFRRTWNSAR
jgi:hypothetical protein